jgi:gas vesicle protein
MDKNTVNRTKTAINALIDIEQLWIDNTPSYNLSTQEIVVLKKRLERVMENISKIYEENMEKMLAAEEEIKKMHEAKDGSS